MILFLDTSALIKLYIAESGSDAMLRKIPDKLVAVSQLTYAETYATFARRRREDLLTADEHQLVVEAFEGGWETAVQVPVSDDVLALVPELCRNHPLRGADALQLAAALMIHRQGVDVHFATSDHRLLDAAEAEGLTVFDPAA